MGGEFQFLNTDGLGNEEIYLELLETRSGNAENIVPDYVFCIRDTVTNEKLGGISLRVGYNEYIYYGGNIGYHVWPEHRGKRYAMKACELVMRLAKRHGMRTLLITCNPENIPSRRTCELLGGELKGIVDLPVHIDMYQNGDRQKCIFEITVQ